MLNHIALLGRLTDNPELRSVGNGVSRATFTLAVNRDFKNKDTGEFEADFIDIVAWRGSADFASKYFTKGQLVVVEGRLQIESYTDREGVRRRAAKVQASQLHFAESRRDNGNNYAGGFNPPPSANAPSPAPGGYTPPGGGGYSAPPSGGGYTPPGGGYGGAAPGGYSVPAPGGYSVPPDQNGGNGDMFRTLSPEEEKELPF